MRYVKKKSTFQSFEASRARDSFVRISDSMMKSEAWRSLNYRQRGLYLEIKSHYRPKTNNQGEIIDWCHEKVVLPEHEWQHGYGNYNTFRKDLDILIQRGFIVIHLRGKNLRQPNQYWFSDAWQSWRPS